MRRSSTGFLFFMLIISLSAFSLFVAESEGAELESKDSEIVEIDPEASPPLDHKATSRFSWGAKVNFSERIRDNRDLDNADGDRDLSTSASLSVAGLMLMPSLKNDPDSRFEVFGELGLEREVRHKEGEGKTDDEVEFRFKKGHVSWRNIRYPGLRLQIGRQRFKDFREWVIDESLDALRLFYENNRLELQISYSSNIFDPEDPEDRIKNLILYGVYDIWKKDKLAGYIINRRGDHSENNPRHLNLTFMGVSWKGKSFKKKKYWLEAATVYGKEEGKDIRGYGFDIGLTSRLKHRFKPTVTIGYAFGSGDSNPDDMRDQNFRQTGLQDNSAKLRGVIKVEQYGELFEPELSNLMILTLAYGIRPLKKASVDLVYHHFQQVWALQERDNELRDVGIKPDPSGQSRNLGDELDVVFGWKLSVNLKVEVISAFFLPGSAFPDSDMAFLGKMSLRYVL